MRTFVAFFALLAVAAANPLPLVQITVNVDAPGYEDAVVIDKPEPVIPPGAIVYPTPVLPVLPEKPIVPPGSIVLPAPEKPIVKPDPIVLPDPSLPIVPPGSIVLPAPGP
ncbi:hypothetical protein ABMA27_013905 [Loxostege sticticalis]|uniref:Uncharacterized protein n=1 Tax=Loxostege sticticalis TaxID=481309 RepID=A0ABR3IBZ3_LOXSC